MIKPIRFKSRGSDIWGFAHFAEGDAPKPTIIMCHGFTGHAAETGRLFVEFAMKANLEGFHVIRFDFAGSGNSAADFAEYTYLGGWIKDLQNAINCAARQKLVDNERIYLVGLSFGGATALMTGKNKRVAAVAAWAPVIDLEGTFRGIFGPKNWQRLEEGEAVSDCYSGTTYHILPHFLEDLRRHNIRKAINQYGGKPWMIIQGTADAVINPVYAQNLTRSFPDTARLLIVENADHVFNYKRQVLFAATLEFFKKLSK